MKKKKYDSAIRSVFVISAVIGALFPILIYILTQSAACLIISYAAAAAMLALTVLLHKTDDAYITDIVQELSELMDSLTELEEKDIFPENEDTVVSKLQTKVVRLVRILRSKSEKSVYEAENIKSLISDISHQLKTPISNLIIYSGFLEDESLTDESRREYVSVLRQSVERLNFLSEGMIKMSRLESGLIRLNMQESCLNETALRAVKSIYAAAKKKDVDIIYNEEKNIILNHDSRWTAEAIFNLLDNAVKYSAAGAKIYLSVKSYGMFSAVEVRDENPPIPENERAEIFTRFYRGANSRNKEGIGIGLYLAREIAMRQGGYIKLRCTDRGNIFEIVLENVQNLI